MSLVKKYWAWVASAFIAFVFLQSLFFKFSNSPETQHIFGELAAFFGMPWFGVYGGYLIGSLELIASIVLFTRVWPWAALLAFEIMSGAIVFHLFTPLGVVMPTFDQAGNINGNDGGTLFVLACITWTCSLSLILKDWTSEKSQLRAVIPTTAKYE